MKFRSYVGGYKIKSRRVLLTAATVLVLMFGGHGKQLVCCVAGWYVPFLQDMQLFWVAFKYVPAKIVGGKRVAIIFRNE